MVKISGEPFVRLPGLKRDTLAELVLGAEKLAMDLPPVGALQRRLGSALVDYLGSDWRAVKDEDLATLMDYVLESDVEDIRHHAAELLGEVLGHRDSPAAREVEQRAHATIQQEVHRRYAATILGHATCEGMPRAETVRGRLSTVEGDRFVALLINIARRASVVGVEADLVRWIEEVGNGAGASKQLVEVLERTSQATTRDVFDVEPVREAMEGLLDRHGGYPLGHTSWRVQALAADRACRDGRGDLVPELVAGMEARDGSSEAKSRMRKAVIDLATRRKVFGPVEGLVEQQLGQLRELEDEQLRYSAGAISGILGRYHGEELGTWLEVLIHDSQNLPRTYPRKTALKLVAKLFASFADRQNLQQAIIEALLVALHDPEAMVREEAVLSLVKRVGRHALTPAQLGDVQETLKPCSDKALLLIRALSARMLGLDHKGGEP